MKQSTKDSWARVGLLFLLLFIVFSLIKCTSTPTFTSRSLTPTQLISANPRLEITGATKSPNARVDLYIDRTFVDSTKSSASKSFSFIRWPYGLGKHKLKVLERGATPSVLLDRNFNSTCKGFDTSAKWMCNDVPSYWKTRQPDTKLLKNSFLQVGINNSIGGTLTQLYSLDQPYAFDRSFNLISEHAGAGIQLSMWGRLGDGSIEAGAYGTHCQKEQIYDGAVNPIQASSPDCKYVGVENNAFTANCGDKCWYTSQANVYQYTQSKILPEMMWTQRVELSEEIVGLTYSAAYLGDVQFQFHPQEMPGVLLHLGTAPTVTWFGFKHPYAATPQIWTEPLEDMEIHSLSVGLNAFQEVTRVMAENWYMMCHADGVKCVTIGLPSSDLWKQVNVEYRNAAQTVYASPLGYLSLFEFNRSWRVNISPYRYEGIRGRVVE